MAIKGYKFGPAQRLLFCAHLAEHGAPTMACAEAEISYACMRTHYNEDDEFRQMYDDAMSQHRDRLYDEAQKRAVEGWIERPIVDKEGNVVGEVRKKSDTLMALLLKRADPSFREQVKIDQTTKHEGSVTVKHDVDLTKLSKKARAKLREVIGELDEAAST